MPTKIGFTVISSTGEDEQYRAADLNYHGPTVKGWRSAQCCSYPQDITLQLQMPVIVHKIQILAHQYLIPQKIEIWTCEDMEYDPSISPCGLQCFQYLGFITLSDNQSTGFKSRELKSVTLPPTPAKFVKLKLHENHPNERNIYNQVGMVAVSVLGDYIPTSSYYGDEVNNNNDQMDSWANTDSNVICNPQYTSPYDDLAFEMYVDKDVARVMRLMETKKHQAVIEERFEYARKLKVALEKLREAGETLGRYEQEKRQAINLEDYDKAKKKKNQIEKYRDEVYTSLQIEQLLELDGQLDDNDRSSSGVAMRYEEKPTYQADSPTESCETPTELEIDVRSPDHSLQKEQLSFQGMSEVRISRSPNRPRLRRTSLTDYTSQSPNPLTHSFSHTNFPTSTSSNHLRQTPCETFPTQFKCYTPYTFHPASNIQPLTDLENMYQSLPPIRLQEPFYLGQGHEMVPKECEEEPERKSPEGRNISQSPVHNVNNINNASRQNTLRGTSKNRSRSSALPMKNSYEAYEERMLPALRHPQIPNNDVVRECQVTLDQSRKSKLNEREKKQAALPISVFGMELVEKFYSKHFADKEEGLRLLQEELKRHMKEHRVDESGKPIPPNKIARASIFLLHRALRDKVYSVYSSAADAIRFFFHEFVPGRVSSTEIARSVEKLMPELIAKSGDVTPRIHNMAAHTLLSMVDCQQVRDLHIIPVHLSRPISSSVHPRLALSRLEMVEQLILNHGISTEKQSGLTCRTLAEFGSSGLHHPAEAVRKVSERILLQVYRVNPRIVRKQLPPDDDVTRRNLLYRQLFQEFDLMDIQRRREQKAAENLKPATNLPALKPSILPLPIKDQKQSATWNPGGTDSSKCSATTKIAGDTKSSIPKRLVNQQTSPMQPIMPTGFELSENDANDNRIRVVIPKLATATKTTIKNAMNNNTESLLPRRNMARISEECNDSEEKEIQQIKHFPNLVDSMHVTETRLIFSNNNNAQSSKSIKYIFPTSYIGTSSKSQDICDKSNKGKSSKSKIPISNIPILKNRNAVISVQKTSKPERVEPDHDVSRNGNVKVKLKIETTEECGDGGSSSASGVSPPCDSGAAVKRQGQTFKTCIFCMAEENWLDEESLNIHYWKSCPMLTRCSKCKEVVEIAGLIQHRLDDCEYRTCYLRCERCQEAILKTEWNEHDCKCSKTGSARLRCPLCHEDLKSEQSWREHLMGDNACAKHPRKTINSNI